MIVFTNILVMFPLIWMPRLLWKPTKLR